MGVIWGFPRIRGTIFGGPNYKDYNILGYILGSPYFGKLPYMGGLTLSLKQGLGSPRHKKRPMRRSRPVRESYGLDHLQSAFGGFRDYGDTWGAI